MGKNRVYPKNDFKKRDNFFTNKKPTFKKPNFVKQPFKNNDITNTTNQSDSGDFFIKPDKVKPSYSSNKTEGDVNNRGENSTIKKPFDKKKWRLQKYSKKYKLQQWEESRKKVVLREYYKEIKDDVPKFDVKKIYESADKGDDEKPFINDCGIEETDNENNLNENINTPNSPNETRQEDSSSRNSKSKRVFKKAHLEFQRIKEEKQKKREELKKKKAERDEALKMYKKEKIEKYKRLNRKTKKGQPIMKERMQMLLEQIQKNVN